MQDTITQNVAGMAGETNRKAVRVPLKAIGDRLSSQTLVSGALRIDGGSASATVELNATYYGIAKGVLVTKASAQNMAALSGTVTNAKYNVFCFFIDSGGTLTSAMGIEGATLAAVTFPPIPEQKAMIGFVIINPSGTGNFVGATTVLDDATVVPNAVFINTVGPFDPSIQL